MSALDQPRATARIGSASILLSPRPTRIAVATAIAARDKSLQAPLAIINAQIDPLRSEGELLAEKIRGAGGSVDQNTYDGVTHEFFGRGAVHTKAKDAATFAADALEKAFGT